MLLPKFAIIGSGNVAHHLCQAFKQNNMNLCQIFSRNISKGSGLAKQAGIEFISDIHQLDDDIDVFVFAITDTAIGEVLATREWNQKMLVHTAGSISIDVFKGFSPNYGVLYPLQSFSSFRTMNYSDIPFCIEANNADNLESVRSLARSISSKIYEMNTDQRQHLHLTAVFVSNYVNHMFSIAQQLSKEKNIPFDIYHPLIRETIAKALESDPVAGQTGPARRNDQPILARHTKMLESHPDWQKIYTFVSQSIINMYK